MTNNNNSPRWIDRFNKYKRALDRLTEIVEESKKRTLNDFEKDSVVQRFEFTHELAWKLMKDYAEYVSIKNIGGSRDAVRQAVTLELITNGDVWLDMDNSRNLTSHIYDEETAADIIDEIIFTYYPLFVELRCKMESIASQEET